MRPFSAILSAISLIFSGGNSSLIRLGGTQTSAIGASMQRDARRSLSFGRADSVLAFSSGTCHLLASEDEASVLGCEGLADFDPVDYRADELTVCKHGGKTLMQLIFCHGITAFGGMPVDLGVELLPHTIN